MIHAVKDETQPGKEKPPALDKRFLVNLKGKEFVQYAGLLDLAHQKGLTELRVDLVQFPCVENGMECIVKAMAATESGMVFCDIGDANPGNTNKSVAQHIIRMASTRAKARVLRDMSNIGITALEEVGEDMADTPGNGNNGNGKKKPPKAAGRASAQSKSKGENGNAPRAVTDAQKRAIWTLAKSKGYNEHSLHDLAESSFGCGVATLSSTDAASLITQLQQGK
ncbi:MAG: hypothetical protein K9K62_08020 [Desulfobacteraceae bacterium]|nr:hypothetical protein [Desulfobacteraceae bacterium]